MVGAALAAAFQWAMVRRNRAITPRALRDLEGRPYRERHFVLSDGARVSLVDAGEGDPPFLLVPGADGVKETYRYQLPIFAGRRRVVATSLRSEFAPGATFDRFAKDLAEVTDALELGPAVVVGQSLGGAIALRFAARYPERVRALVLSNTLARVTLDHVGLNWTLAAPLAMTTTRYLPTPLARLAARLWSRWSVWIFDDSAGSENVIDYALWCGPRAVSPVVSQARVNRLAGLDLRPELARIDAPALVLRGPKDSYCGPDWASDIARRLPNAAYREIAGTGHCSHLSRPGAFNRAILEWLESLPGEARTEVERARMPEERTEEKRERTPEERTKEESERAPAERERPDEEGERAPRGSASPEDDTPETGPGGKAGE